MRMDIRQNDNANLVYVVLCSIWRMNPISTRLALLV
ncbi:hypothetical protein NC652_010781 [Populus alba x Populus x berolinensis]|nr:hypothetical protein NC652_010781 [Populus alba x Populus x berolinensis]